MLGRDEQLRVQDAAHIALELAAHVEGGVDPAVVVHHLGADSAGGLKSDIAMGRHVGVIKRDFVALPVARSSDSWGRPIF